LRLVFLIMLIINILEVEKVEAANSDKALYIGDKPVFLNNKNRKEAGMNE